MNREKLWEKSWPKLLERERERRNLTKNKCRKNKNNEKIREKETAGNIKTGIYEIEQAGKFKYLENIIDSAEERTPKIQQKVHKANRTLH